MSQVTSARRWRVDYGEPLLLGEMNPSVLSRAMPLTWLSRRSNSLFLFFPSSHTAHGTDHESQGATACPTPAPFTSFLTSTFVHRFDSLRCAHIGSICWLFVRLFMLRHDLFVLRHDLFVSRLELFFFVRCHGVEPMALGPQSLSCFLALFSLPSPLSSPLSSLVAFSVGSFCVSGVIWSVPFEANATRSAHRWLLHRWLSVLFSFRSLPLSPPSLFNLALALSSSLSLLMLQFVQGSPTVASSPSIKLYHAAVSV